MKDGFIKVAAATPDVRVADCEYNATEIIRMIHEMEEQGAKVMVFPELCITAYTCGDLFWQENLLEEAKVQLVRIAEEAKEVGALIYVGLRRVLFSADRCACVGGGRTDLCRTPSGIQW